MVSGEAAESCIYVSGVHHTGITTVLTFVPISSGDLRSAQAVKWDFVSSYVRSPLPLNCVETLACLYRTLTHTSSCITLSIIQ